MTTITETTRYGTATAAAWGRLHQRLASRGGWEGHDGKLPVIEGTLIGLAVDHLPGDRSPERLWLWSSRAGADPAAVDRAWQAFLRRFDIEHIQVPEADARLDPARSAATTWPPPTAGPGSSSPATPSSGWPADSPKTCGWPGSGLPCPAC